MSMVGTGVGTIAFIVAGITMATAVGIADKKLTNNFNRMVDKIGRLAEEATDSRTT
jgi:hypothetical protein